MKKLSVLDMAKHYGVSVSTMRRYLSEAGLSLGRDSSWESIFRFMESFDSGLGRYRVDVDLLRRMREGNLAERRESREKRKARKKREVPVQFRKSFEHDDGFVEDVVIEADDSFQEFDFE